MIKQRWFAVEARQEGYVIMDDKFNPVIGTYDEDGCIGPLTEDLATEICVLHNTFRGYDIKDIEDKGIVSIVGDKLLKQDEIIKNLVSLVEHYGNCYNHDLNAYKEARLAKKYTEEGQ